MKAWTSDELQRIGSAEEMKLSSLRQDGTLRRPVIIWVIHLDNDLYIRCVNGRRGAWFRGTQVRHEGRIRVGNFEKDVCFVDADPEIHDQIDAVYRSKYRRYSVSIINSVLTPQARSATIKIVPR